MLTRITKLKNIGTFSNDAPASVRFEPVTLIYGRNTYGKSTLADLFASLQSGNPENLQKRKSIPGVDGGSESVLSFKLQGATGNESTAKYAQDNWQKPLPADHRLKVFDDAFYHDNVFSSRSFTAETKQNFSSFVLGAQGTSKAREIEDKKQTLNALRKELKDLLDQSFQGIVDVDQFIASELPKDPLGELSKQEQLEKDILVLKTNKDNAESILARAALSALILQDESLETIEAINSILQSSLDDFHETAKNKVLNHVKEHFTVQQGGEFWLQQGVRFDKGQSCVYCGQDYNNDALKLLETFRQCFDDAYERHVNFVNSQQTETVARFTKWVDHRVLSKIDTNLAYAQAYSELAKDEGFKQLLKSLLQSQEQLKALEPQLCNSRQELLENIHQQVIKKKDMPFDPIDSVDDSATKALMLQREQLIEGINLTIDAINQSITTLKDGLNKADLDSAIEQLEKELDAVALNVRRYQSVEQCNEYLDTSRAIHVLEREIPQQEEELEKEQSAFLDCFFADINKYFKCFGSHDFLLRRGVIEREGRQVHHLEVVYRDQIVSEDHLDVLFSESDRRALSLAVFWAGIKGLPAEDKKGMIVVLDDPVTSFDDHRVSNSIDQIAALQGEVEQVIMLSHYKHGIADFIRKYQRTHKLKLIEITKDQHGSHLSNGETTSFIRSEHENKREQIMDFIDCKTTCQSVDLRVFLEMELSLRFGKQLREKAINNDKLGERIDALSDHGVITDTVKDKLHQWRQSFNPKSHTWVDDEIDNVRNTARMFMNFIFNELKT
jgi:wobble nucleotide-excising tRNase